MMAKLYLCHLDREKLTAAPARKARTENYNRLALIIVIVIVSLYPERSRLKLPMSSITDLNFALS